MTSRQCNPTSSRHRSRKRGGSRKSWTRTCTPRPLRRLFDETSFQSSQCSRPRRHTSLPLRRTMMKYDPFHFLESAPCPRSHALHVVAFRHSAFWQKDLGHLPEDRLRRLQLRPAGKHPRLQAHPAVRHHRARLIRLGRILLRMETRLPMTRLLREKQTHRCLSTSF